MDKKIFVDRRVWWNVAALVVLAGVSLALVLAPARASHRPQIDVPTQFHERVELGDPGKTGALFVYCDTGYRVWVATTPSGNVSVFGVAARDACPVDPALLHP